MKIATNMLALSLVPCGDGGGGLVEIADHIFGIKHQLHNDHEQHSDSCGDDLCSPFCICSCCSLVLDAPERVPFQVEPPAPIEVVAPSFVPNIIPSSYCPSFWQPPRYS